jgi:phospholipid/cholesterol/gamma-HCH transport system substrate-binding protein
MESGMEREANYAAVGAFVLMLLVMGGLFIFWYTDSREQRNYTRYEIYFDGSVSGLSEGGPVRYLGVDVGKVWRIRLDQRAADRVMTIVDIDSTTPVSSRTLAQLSLQGVTGLLYIDLLQERDGGTQKVLDTVPSVQYPVIRSVRSNFDTFVSSLPEIAARLGELSVRANSVFSDQNIAAVGRLLGNLDQAGASLPDATRNMGDLVRELRAATADSRVLIQRLQGAVQTAGPDLAAAMERLRVTANNMAQASAKLDDMVAENRADIRNFARDGLPQLEALVRDSRAAAQEFQQLSRTLRENPSKIIYQPPVSGVEIPR